MVSIWEKQSFLTSDIIIIGAGITGLSAAASLKEVNPKLKVSILERGLLPSGASTKNAGFACFGSISELLNDINTLGEDGMINLVESRIQGLEKTTKRLDKKAIDLQVKGGYELLFEKSDETLHKLNDINKLLHYRYNDNIYEVSNEKIEQFGFSGVSHLIENKYEGQLDTGKLISSLWDYCSSLGIKIYTGCEVIDFHLKNDGVEIATQSITFFAKKVGICTNAFTKHILNEELDLTPGRGLVMSILPEDPLKIQGTFHYDEGYYYFRDYYGKLIYGGARNLAIAEETTTDLAVNERVKNKLLEDLSRIILPNQAFTIESEWSGIMAFGENKKPIVKPINENMAIGVRLGGMGVAIGSLVGEELAKIILA